MSCVAVLARGPAWRKSKAQFGMAQRACTYCGQPPEDAAHPLRLTGVALTHTPAQVARVLSAAAFGRVVDVAGRRLDLAYNVADRGGAVRTVHMRGRLLAWHGVALARVRMWWGAASDAEFAALWAAYVADTFPRSAM